MKRFRELLDEAKKLDKEMKEHGMCVLIAPISVKKEKSIDYLIHKYAPVLERMANEEKE